MFKSINVLVIEDNLGDFELLEVYLRKTNIDAKHIYHAKTLQQGIDYLTTINVDLLLLDLSLPDSLAEHSYHQIQLSNNRVPVVVLSGSNNHELALSIVKAGAQDYLVKGEVTSGILEKTILYAIERKKNLEQLQQSQLQYQFLFDNNPLPMWTYDVDTLKFTMVNNAAIMHYGYSRDEFLQMTIMHIRPQEDRERALQFTKTSQIHPYRNAGTWTHIKKNGQHIQVEITSHLIEIGGKTLKLVVAYDITEKIKAKAELEKSERTFRSLAEFFPGAITILNSDMVMEYTNGMEYQSIGVDPAWHIGKQFLYTYHYQEQRQAILASLKKCLDGETIKFNLARNDKIYSNIATPIIYNDSAEKKIVVITLDVTERNRIEQHLKLLESVVVNSSNGVMIIDKPHDDTVRPKIVFANKAQCNITGYTLAEILGSDPDMFIGEKTSNAVHKRMANAMSKNRVVEADLINYKKDGSTYWVHQSIIPVFNNDGVCTHFVSLTSDITERKLAEQKIKEANASLKERNRKIYEIARINSHVIRKPVASILGLTSLLSNNNISNQEIADIISHITACAVELDAVIHTIAQKAI